MCANPRQMTQEGAKRIHSFKMGQPYIEVERQIFSYGFQIGYEEANKGLKFFFSEKT